MSLYLDADVLVASLLQEARTPAVIRYFARAQDPLAVSDYAAAEVASAISRLIRTGKLSEPAGHAALGDFDAWRLAWAVPMEIENGDIVTAGALVRRFDLKLRAPDALHLAVCLRAGTNLVSYDGRLIAAATAYGVKTIQP